MQKPEEVIDRETLRKRIVSSLRSQGYRFRKGLIVPPKNPTKEEIRKLHTVAVQHRIELAKSGLVRKEGRLLQRIASGCEIDATLMRPKLVEVMPKTEDELLFRYASLHWSIPVSSGYGRRLRFLVIDQNNDKLMGIMGIGDPVFALKSRDNWVGWSADKRLQRLKNVMDAFALGAVPPYSHLLCGKLVAMLVTSNTVRLAFKRKYSGRESRISEQTHDGKLALVTTSSALGRSSIYNRLRFGGPTLFHDIGYTRGTGEFHFSNGLYKTVSQFAVATCEATARNQKWGTGFRNRREVVKKVLVELGISSQWLEHGVQRQVF